MIVLARSVANLNEALFPAWGQVQSIEPAVAFGGPPLQEVSRLKLVQHADQTACVHVQRIGKVLLRNSRRLRNYAQNPRMVGSKAQWLQLLCKFCSRVTTELRQ